MTDKNTVTLTRPLKDTKGNEVTTLTFREPTVGDLMASEKLSGNVSKIAAIIARQNDLTIPVIEGMLSRDFQKCDAIIGALMGNDQPKDGETPQS